MTGWGLPAWDCDPKSRLNLPTLTQPVFPKCLQCTWTLGIGAKQYRCILRKHIHTGTNIIIMTNTFVHILSTYKHDTVDPRTT